MHTHSTVARPLPLSGEEVVISGISGCYPESGNVREFQENLFNKVDMITDDDRRWKADNSGVPHRTGKVPVVNKFDAAFFGSSALQAKALDPQNRLLMEKTCEALLDAGINPTHLKGKNVGVFIGMSFVEAERAWQFESPLPDGISYTHTARGLIASRISRFYGINGPCHIVDTACSSSMYAFDCALKAIHDGRCDSAFICTTTLCLLQNPSFHFWRLGVINSEGKCKCFDNEGNGYARSETVVAFYVQKAKDAKRVYASVVHIKTNCDGYKEQGITFPSAKIQGRLLEDFYQECSVDPTSVHFVEAHATGTKVGDPEEISALDKVFCKGRKEPLLIGSVKSNMGHTEPGSALVSMTKVLITMETGFIPPNINFNSPREGVEALETGRMKVVTDKHPYDKSLIAVNSFGFGGANGHCLLRRNEKVKQNGGVPEDPLPRLVLVAGRVKESVEVTLRDFENRPVDAEYVYLMNDLHSSEIPGFLYRGYSLLTEDNKKPRNIQRHAAEHKRPVWFVFPGLCSLHSGMGKSLMQIPTFSEAISKCEKTLKEFSVNVKDIITSDDPNIFNNIVNCFVGNAAYQVGLVDIIKKVGIEPDGLIGYSVGELGCSYMDGSLTAQQVMLVAYYQGYALAQTKTLKGLMVTVGLGAEKLRRICPSGIEIVCHNGPNNFTLAGPVDKIEKFVKMLQTQGHFVKVVNSANTFFHNTCASACTASLLRSLQKVIPNPKPRSPFWKSSSVPESAWHSPKATFSSAEYHTNVLSSAVLFEEASRHIPDDAITIEITPNGQQLNIQSRSLFKQIQNVALTKENHPDAVQNLFSSLGELFILGLHPAVNNLYPIVSYPVSRGTPMISPLIKWEHSQDWFVYNVLNKCFVKSRERTVKINLGDLEMAYLGGHVIDGRVLYPAMGYVVLVWECMAFINSLAYEDMDVVFDNLQFHRATNLPKEGHVVFGIAIQKETGRFEISESGASVVTGTIRVPNDISREWLELDPPQDVTGEDDVDFSSRDIYKELRLRGYNYQGQFRSIVSANAAGSKGKIRWFDNWVAHMDNMLQMQILQEDTRGLFVPISIGKLTINTSKHHALLSDLKKEMEQPEIPVYVHKDMNIIRSGGVEIRALIASAITKRKPLGEPVVEKHLFVPCIEPDQLDVKDALRVCVHMMLENVIGIRVKAVEVYNEDAAPLSPELAVILGDLPLIQADITLLANQPLQDIEPVGFKINNSVLSEEEKCLLVIVSNTMDNNELLETALKVIAEGGFILVRERSDFQSSLFTKQHGIEAVFVKSVDNEKLVLFRKTAVDSPSVIIKICSSNYDWLPKVQAAVASSSKQSILLVAQNDPLCGILGLVNCILKESNGHDVRCMFILDESAPTFDVKLPFYQRQLDKNLAINIYCNRHWGTYRHLPIKDFPLVKVPNAYVNVTTRGDLSSLTWIQGKRVCDIPESERVHVYYSALNFKDVMTATGKIPLEVAAKFRLSQDNVQGLEYSGRDVNGRRVMGMVGGGATATMLHADKNLMWNVPDHWTLEDAATVPVVYGTAYFALLMCGDMKKGESILIHAGSGGVGMAAIHICLHAGCTVFTTVGTNEKREFIKKKFPQLTDEYIGNSRDTSFEQLVMQQTNGRGVDLVLNSLAEEKLQASLRCLAVGGRFLEIGKADLSKNNPVPMEIILKGVSFHGIGLDYYFWATHKEKHALNDILTEGIKSGAVQPLTRTVFLGTEVEQAFRYMAAGKHIGKVLLKITTEEPEKIIRPVPKVVEARAHYHCIPDSSYIIAGGLGGFGLELADWLVLRGARKLILTTHSGLKNGYQSSRIRVWRSYGVEVLILRDDITTESGVKSLLMKATDLGPVAAIFNLAVELRDAILENQSEDDFVASAKPKAIATLNLDKWSRKLCPELRNFVVFSSVSCGRGNAGQTNYGMSNSVMERICEARVKDGLPGLAIQWGAVGDVGLVANMQEENTDIVIGGTLPQRISSCLEELGMFMTQSHPVVASMVVAEKRLGGDGSGTIKERVSNIMDIRDLKNISLHSTLAELGMDSMMAVEIKQCLEREFAIYLTPPEIRSLTFTRLAELSEVKKEEEKLVKEEEKTVKEEGKTVKEEEKTVKEEERTVKEEERTVKEEERTVKEEERTVKEEERTVKEEEKTMKKGVIPSRVALEGLELAARVLGDEEESKKIILRLPSIVQAENSTPMLIMFPGIEGVGSVLAPLAKNLQYQPICIQYAFNSLGTTVKKMADSFMEDVINHIDQPFFNLLGYSFGGLLALEIVLQLEEKGLTGNLFLVDSSPDFLQTFVKILYGTGKDETQIQIIKIFFKGFAKEKPTLEAVEKLAEEVAQLKNYPDRLKYMVDAAGNTQYSKVFQMALGTAVYKRLKAIQQYNWFSEKKIQSKVILIRTEAQVVPSDDYGLSKICNQKVEVHCIPGNHVTILDSQETANIINEHVKLCSN